MRLFVCALVACLPVHLWAQSKVYGNRIYQAGATIDSTAAAHTKPFQSGSSLPAQCTQGDWFYTPGVPGSLSICTSANTWTTYASGSGGISAITGDVTASGTGSVAATLATVNSNVGTFGSTSQIPVLTLDAKGRVTAASTVAAPSGGGGPASIPSGNTASVPASGSPGALYNVTDSTSGLPYYYYNPSGNALKLLDIGPSGGITMATAGQIDINTSVVPRLAAANSFTGSNTFGGTTTLSALNVTGGCTGCTSPGTITNPMTTLGDIISGGTNGAPARLPIGAAGQVLTVSSGNQPVWSTPNSTPSNLTARELDLDDEAGGNATINMKTTASGSNPWLMSVTSQTDPTPDYFTFYKPNLGRIETLFGSSGSNGQFNHYFDASAISGLTGGKKTAIYVGTGVGWYNYTDSKQILNAGLSDPNIAQTGYGWQINTGTSGVAQPPCAVGIAATFWFTPGASGTKDTVQVCAKDGGNAYAWRTIY